MVRVVLTESLTCPNCSWPKCMEKRVRNGTAGTEQPENRKRTCFMPGCCIWAVWTWFLEWEGGKKLQQLLSDDQYWGIWERNPVLASCTHSSVSRRREGLGHWESTGRSELVRVGLVQGVDKQLEHGCEYFMCWGIWEISCLGYRKCSSPPYSVYSIKFPYLGWAEQNSPAQNRINIADICTELLLTDCRAAAAALRTEGFSS